MTDNAKITKLVDFESNKVSIDSLAIMLFYANLCADYLGVSLRNDEGWLWSSEYGKIIKIHYNHVGRILECGYQGDDLTRFEFTIKRNEINHLLWVDQMPRLKSKYLRPRARLL